jgi:hypothetical protein
MLPTPLRSEADLWRRRKEVLNWAGLMSLLIALVGALCGIAGARGEKAGGLVSILFGIAGLVVGLGGSFLSHKLAYSALRKGAGILYMAVPMLILFAVGGFTAFLASVLVQPEMDNW